MCEATAELLYNQFNQNIDDNNPELSLIEFITFYVNYYETDQISPTLFAYCDTDKNEYLSLHEFDECYCAGFDEGNNGGGGDNGGGGNDECENIALIEF